MRMDPSGEKMEMMGEDQEAVGWLQQHSSVQGTETVIHLLTLMTLSPLCYTSVTMLHTSDHEAHSFFYLNCNSRGGLSSSVFIVSVI